MNPPPVLHSAKLLFYAINTSDVEYTDRINLIVGTSDDGFEKIGELPHLAITQTYDNKDYLLMFCDKDWDTKGVIAYSSIKEAKIKAERVYIGITEKWKESPYSQEQIDNFLRDEYDVDPQSEWWLTKCSFCGRKDNLESIVEGKYATICKQCVHEFYKEFYE